MPSQQKLVSIITPAWNAAEFLRESIAAVRTQDYQNWQHVIVDDASTDNTWQVIAEAMAADERVKGVRMQDNVGAAKARNAAIENAEGSYIAFLDGDDLWAPDKLSKQVAFMQETKVALSYTPYHIVDQSNQVISTFNVPAELTYKQLLRANVIGCSTAMYDVEKLGKVFMPLVKKRQDFALWLKILRGGEMAKSLSEPLASYRIRENSLSSNKASAAYHTWKVYRDVEKLPLLLSVRYFIEYAVRAVLKYSK